MRNVKAESRTHYGNYETNYSILISNLRHYEVEDYIRLYPHYLTFENSNEVLALVKTEKIAALVHDADGRIDRDFSIFWHRLIPGGKILIDDYQNHPEFQLISSSFPDGGTKKLRTYRLLNQFIEWGLFKPDFVSGSMIFGHKPVDADFSRFDFAQCRAIIDQIMEERAAYLKQR